MKHAVIDVGSNSLHLTVYEIAGGQFKSLFRSKIMAGLAGYVKNGRMSEEGIQEAQTALLEFRETLQSLSIDQVSVFATASLRNIENTEEALLRLRQATGFPIEVISGREEALLSYAGASLDVPLSDGAFTDIGGASTEIISFTDGKVLCSASCQVGSLSLYKKCVGMVLPGQKSMERMEKLMEEELDRLQDFSFTKHENLISVGGTARTVLKLAKKKYDLPDSCQILQKAQIEELYDLFCRKDKKIIKLILRLAPDRIHTVVPGLFILRTFLEAFEAKHVIVSKYGIREGFLCRKDIQ